MAERACYMCGVGGEKLEQIGFEQITTPGYSPSAPQNGRAPIICLKCKAQLVLAPLYRAGKR